MQDKIALVTGASRGIGLGIAKKLASSGYFVIGTATSDVGVDSFQAAFSASGLSGYSMLLNVNDPENISNLFNKIKEKYDQHPAVLVNNAAVTDDDLFLRMRKDKWDKVIDTNLTAQYQVIKAAIRPMLKAKWGRIINISSVVALSGNAGQANYVAAKAGLIGLTKSLALEYASNTRDITVNAVAPGFIATDMTKDLSEVQSERILSKIPMKRMGSIEEVAAVVAFLANSETSYITGQTFHVNGGMLMV
ncbi:MAG: 3-oxoacyl-[acyl-carrier-protein] reductase [Pseudomonadota bacterium]|nr:3-oxoacyl-[acyl-carrier-protein] reductase [Pseudomonadota bacterium]